MASGFFVIKLKDVIKTAVFALLGVIIIAAVIVFLFGGDKNTYKEGTYTSEIILHGDPVTVSVTVSSSQIENISLQQLNDTQEVFYPTFSDCIDDISEQVIALQSTNIELDKDYEVTGTILLNAIDNALEDARK